jgi:sulfide dehydrogenase cytochrome subunit
MASSALLLFSFSAWAASPHDPDSHIQILAATCATCHGTNGNSVGGTPILAGMDKSYFTAQMLAFSSGKRPSSVMQRHSKPLTGDEIELLGQYFSVQTRKSASMPAHPVKN